MWDDIKKGFWLYLAGIALLMVLFHTCAVAIDKDVKSYKDKIEKHLASTQTDYVTERGSK